MSIKIINATIFTGNAVLQHAAIGIVNGKFTDDLSQPFDDIIDFENDMLVPGFIDLQLYGGNGKLFSDDPSTASLQATYQYSLKGGATNILPTVATNSTELIFKAIDAVKAYRQQYDGILGLHLEGPFINPKKKGAHLEQYIVQPTMAFAKELVAAAGDVVKIITLAPECCDEAVIKYFIDNGIKISIGHSDATFEAANKAFNTGATLVTHLFNAMSPLGHRQPGLAGAVFQHGTALSSIVADGFHVDFNVIAIAKKVMQQRLFLITDAVTGSKGVYPHILQDERYVLPDGTLSGSALTMLKAVKNCIDKAGIEKEEAFRMASLYPAKAIGIDDRYGKIENGYTADYIRLSEGFDIKAVAKNGLLQKI